MKKQNVVNLIKYHAENNNEAFISEVAEIARDFDANGDDTIAQYIMELVSNANFYVPQHSYKNLKYLRKLEYSTKPLLLPDADKSIYIFFICIPNISFPYCRN